ncbi:transposase [Fusobacterium ulcerans]|uniref:transposase n=1 Tax=Fusobacterium ulcerans TaxID=861 RepID=UPI001D09BB3D|nr:transposase [Fusobacterium ulcerans]MCB8648700.1 transposase [Fusobacterium ulcerans]
MAISLTYRKYPNRFYFNSDNLINNPEEITKYIGSYLARPAIAEYRITFFNSSIVKFWFKNLDSNNKIFLTLDIILLAHRDTTKLSQLIRYDYYLSIFLIHSREGIILFPLHINRN